MKKRITIRVGTRGSRLALAQTEQIVRLLVEAHPRLHVKIVRITTKGDRAVGTPVARIGGQGLFTKELEKALRERKIDVAVHSLKDLPTALSPGLTIGAVPKRADPRDAAVTRGRVPLARLPAGSKVGTSSLRRRTQLAALNPGVKTVDLRGNLDTRLAKVEAGTGGLAAIVVAMAGLERIGLAAAAGAEPIPVDVMIPAPGQGALALEVRDDERTRREIVPLLEAVHDPATAAATAAERTLLRRIEGGCLVPFGAHAEAAEDGLLRLRAVIASPDGTKVYRAEATGAADDPEGLAAAAEFRLREAGAAGAIDAWRARSSPAGLRPPSQRKGAKARRRKQT